MPPYPPEPWDLRGQLYTSVFRVPLAAFAPGELDELPPGWTLVAPGGSAVVGAAWVDYQPNGVLAYRELMATVLMRRRWRLAPHVLRIWVDSEASRDGGRELWAIPKELADFELGSERWQSRFSARIPGETAPIAASTISRGVGLPGRWLLRFAVVQTRGGAAQVSPVRARAALMLTRSRWIAEAFGPLGFLAGRRPLLTVAVRDFAMMFGSAPPVKKRGEPVRSLS